MAVMQADRNVVDLHRYQLDGTDRVSRTPTVVARGVRAPEGLHLNRAGKLVVLDGTPEYAVWTLERASTSSTTFTQRRLSQSTAYLMGSITDAGARVLLVRERPTAPRTRELSTVAFEGGAERSLGTFEDLIDWDLSSDGRTVLLVQGRGAGDLVLPELDVATAQRTRVTTSGNRSWFETVAGGDRFTSRGTRSGPDRHQGT
jgi:hypothetical protein